jgi:hypothetical protein
MEEYATLCQKDFNKDLYSKIENLIVIWSNDGTKTAGTLTRQIMELLNKDNDNLKSQAKEPKYAVKGDYCAVCRGTEFWNDEEE